MGRWLYSTSNQHDRVILSPFFAALEENIDKGKTKIFLSTLYVQCLDKVRVQEETDWNIYVVIVRKSSRTLLTQLRGRTVSLAFQRVRKPGSIRGAHQTGSSTIPRVPPSILNMGPPC